MLHSVTEKAQICGPCALSALTGLSSDTWPDVDMDKRAIPEELEKVGFNAEFGGWFLKPLSRFRRHGVWLLELRYPNPENGMLVPDLHVIAYARRRGEIQIADNAMRVPVSISPGTGWREFSLPPEASEMQRAIIRHGRYLKQMRGVKVDAFYRVTKKPE